MKHHKDGGSCYYLWLLSDYMLARRKFGSHLMTPDDHEVPSLLLHPY